MPKYNIDREIESMSRRDLELLAHFLLGAASTLDQFDCDPETTFERLYDGFRINHPAAEPEPARYYFGLKDDTGSVCVFEAAQEPTSETHGNTYTHIYGGYETRGEANKAAAFMYSNKVIVNI